MVQAYFGAKKISLLADQLLTVAFYPLGVDATVHHIEAHMPTPMPPTDHLVDLPTPIQGSVN